jgi:choline-sulfatase
MARRHNILIFCADQLRADALGCYGNRICKTPNLDALAASGIVFENAFTPNPVCVPARASITTGNYAHRATGVKGNGGRIRDGQPRLAAHFAARGYETYACGKLHYVPYAPPDQPRLLHGFQHCDLTESGRILQQFDPHGKRRGLEDYVDYLDSVGWGGYSRAHGVGNNDVRPCPTPLPADHHVDVWVANSANRRLYEHADLRRGQPFLIWCGFPKPHPPLDPPYEFVKLYDVRDVPNPLGDASLLENRNPELTRTRVTHGFDALSPAAQRVAKMFYYALVSYQDAQVGRVLAALREVGAADNTIVIFTSDHGDLLGDFGSYFKCNFLQGSVRVPLIVSLPGGPRGARRKQLVGLQDILPTLAALSGCPIDQEVQGLDLTPALHDEKAPVRDVFYGQCLDAPRQLAMVFDGRWKYCYAQEGSTEELYDLAEDPQEMANLAGRPGAEALLKPWRGRLIAEARRLGDVALLDGDRLVAAPLDRDALKTLPLGGFGWRWF